MRKMDLEIKYKPSLFDLETIKKHSEKEQITGNIKSVINSFYRNELIVLVKDKELIGYSAYEYSEPVSKINVFLIIKKYRFSGFGKILADLTLNEITNKKGEIVELFCSPIDSKYFWKKMDFKKLSKEIDVSGHTTMYKILVDCLLPIGKNNDEEIEEIIELWNVGTSKANTEKPKWKWKIDSTKIQFPIIHPADPDWQVCWRKGDKIKNKGRVKNLEHNKGNVSDYLIFKKNTKHNN